jgi:uncharacterized RDD family membrane protein YckC
VPEPTGAAVPTTGLLNLPKLPVAGFWIRLLAFIIDLFLILGAFHLLSRSLPQIYWTLGKWSPYLNSALMFAYFVAFNGPFGRGRTVGKLLVRIRVSNYDGDPPTFRQAVIRTVVLMPAFVLVPVAQAFIGTPQGPGETYASLLISSAPSIAIWLSTLVIVGFNPFKQGLHDYLAQTLVRPDAFGQKQQAPSFEDLAVSIGRDWKQFHRQPQISGAVTIGLIIVALAYLYYPGRWPETMKRIDEALYGLKRQPGLETAITSREGPYSLATYKANYKEREWPEVTSDDSLSTETLVFIVTAATDSDWREILPPAARETAANQVIDVFHNAVFRETLRRAEEDGTKEELDFIKTARSNACHYVVIFSSAAFLTPYPFPLTRQDFLIQKTLPPIGPEKDTAPTTEDTNPDSSTLGSP